MKILRRDLFRWGLAGTVLVSTKPLYSQEKVQVFKEGPSVLQGATDDTQTQFSIVYNSAIQLDIFVTNNKGQRWEPSETHIHTFQGHSKSITKAYFANLFPHETFFLHVVDKVSGQELDIREFETLDTSKASLRFGICSCMNEKEHDARIWQDIVVKKPDVLFFIGDSCYADSGAGLGGADPAHLWKRFCEARTTLDIYYSKKLIPIIATWDDHDFGLNDSSRHSYKFINESQTNFLQFFAQDPRFCQLLERGPGVSSAFRYANQLFILLDDRSFREAKGSSDRYAHWGQEQNLWMLDLMAKNVGPTWLMNGGQFFPEVFWKESVSRDHEVQFNGMKDDIKAVASRVIFVSGDVHYSEISRIEPEALGYETFEITSSSIHSKVMPGSPHIIPNRRRVMGTGVRNYIVVESIAKGHGCYFKAICYGMDGQSKFQLEREI